MREQQSPSQVLFELSAEDEAQKHGSGMKAEFDQHIAHGADHERLPDGEEVVVAAINAYADEQQRARIEISIGNGQ